MAACVLWSLAIQEAITNARPDEPFDFEAAVRNGMEHVAEDRRKKWGRLITESVEGPPTKFNPNGWVVTAFQAALSAIVNTPVPEEQPAGHLRDALVAAVRIGDDTDTVAAIAGGMVARVFQSPRLDANARMGRGHGPGMRIGLGGTL